MEIPLLEQILIVFGVAIPIVFLFSILRIPDIVGLLFTGILIGPQGIGLVHAHEEVEKLAELGVVLLLFTIGIEFSLKKLWKMKKSVLVGGSLQMFLTIAATASLLWLWQWPLNQAVFFGCLLAPSSTAIVLKMLQERGEIDTPPGKTALAVLIYQDIVIVPMMLLLPLLSGKMADPIGELGLLLAKGLAIVIVALVSAIWIVPKLLYHIAKTRNRELFLLSIVAIALTVALSTMKMGLSLGLGAFLAGLIISESRYSYQALAGILPFKKTFLPFFFISIGMLLDVHFLMGKFAIVALVAIAVLLGKFLIIVAIALFLDLSLKSAIVTGMTISQVGEFSFVLATAGLTAGLSLGDFYQSFLAVSILSMAATPFLIAVAPKLAKSMAKFPLFKKLAKEERDLADLPSTDNKEHLIIVGFGLNGHNLARVAKESNISYVIIEMNPVAVRRYFAQGEPIYYGDATHYIILEHADIQRAKVLVVAISDPLAIGHIVSIARNLNPNLHIIARTRTVTEVEHLYQCGADAVIPEEFETSIEIFGLVLRKYLIAEDKIHDFSQQIRANSYRMLRRSPKYRQ